MPEWHGNNWQLTGSTDQLSSIGVSFGYGLLDEPLSEAGMLSTVLGALHAELARPVELGPGNVVIPEVSSSIGSDTCTLVVRGRNETVTAAFSRLPQVFGHGTLATSGTADEEYTPLWPSDLIARTGRNAAALGGFKIKPADPAARAGKLLAHLDPHAAATCSVFFTNDARLVGAVYPVTAQSSGAVAASWADGTARRTAQPLSDAPADRANPLEGIARDNNSGMVHGNFSPVLFSLLVPRSASGYLAAQVLNRQVSNRLSAQLGNAVGVAVELTGMGRDFCATFRSELTLEESQRRALQGDLLLSLGHIPESWISDVPGFETVGDSDLMQRERVLVGLPATEAPRNDEVLRIISSATATLHAAVDPEHGQKPRRRPRPASDDSVQFGIDELRLPAPGRARYFRSWASRGFSGAPLAVVPGINVGRRSMYADYWQRYRVQGPTAGMAVDLDELLAVLEDQHGNLFVFDAKLRMLRIYPQLYYTPARLRRQIEQVTAGVPWLAVASGLSKEQVERWTTKRRRRIGTVVGVAVLFVGAWVALVTTGQQHAEPVTERINISETANLANGSTLTATRFDIRHPTVDDQEYTVTVEVNFCAGADTAIEGFAPESQRMISPADFAMYNASYAQARMIDSPNQLREQAVQPGECVIGNLVFRDRMLAEPRLAFGNAVGDDVVWYSYGKVPEQYR